MHRFEVGTEYTDSHDGGSPQAPRPYDLFHNARTRYGHGNNGVKPGLLPPPDLSGHHIQSSEEVPPCPDSKQDTPPELPARLGAAPRLSQLQRSPTFKRQDGEQRKNLTPVINGCRAVPRVRQRDSGAVRRPPRQVKRAPLDLYYPSVDERTGPNTLTRISQEPSEDLEAEPEMLLQPDTRPISHEQLVVEVKGIYAGLVMVEAKCIDIDERQSIAAQEKDPAKRMNLKNDQWQSLIALHKQLLHEHYDFFLASQHPSASLALSRLIAKYSMPAWMWRYGIHAFLEVLRHRLPESLEHMLAFIYIAYSMMALLYKTVSIFEDTWIECLGDLGRYRMAIKDDKPEDREVWSNVARFWYKKAADKSLNVGRLYHHLAILACPYTRFNPVVQGQSDVHPRSWLSVSSFIGAHGIFSNRKSLDFLDQFFITVDDLQVDKLSEQSAYNIIKLESDFARPARGPCSLLPKIYMGCSQIYTQPWCPEDSFRNTEMDHDGWPVDLPSMPRPRIERKAWLGVRITPASWRIFGNKLYARIGRAVLIGSAPRRKSLSINFPLFVPFIATCLPAVDGSPIGTPEKADVPAIITTSVHLLVGSLYVGFAAAALATAHSLALRMGPIRVWASMMGISAYGWWAVKNDASASPSLSITNLGVWIISAFQYGHSTFQEFRIPERVLLITLLGALMIDMAIVRFMTPSGAVISQSDLLSLSLPAMSLSLAITSNLFGCFRSQPQSPPPSHETEVGDTVFRGHRHIEGSLQPRTVVPDLDTSRFRLLGSPLAEDSTRIWENDD